MQVLIDHQNCPDGARYHAGTKPLLTEFGVNQILESFVKLLTKKWSTYLKNFLKGKMGFA